MEQKWSISLALWRLEVRGLVFSHNLCIISFLLETHKCLFVKSDCCEFNWWNSCLCFDVIFSIDIVVVMRCCCWWLKPWVIIFIELWCQFVCSLKVLQKWVKWCFVMKWCFGSNFIWIWVSFYVYKRLDKHWEQIWALGIQNWDFGVKMEFYLRANCHSSPWRANWWSWRVTKCPARHGKWFGGHGELLSAATHVFVVLGFLGPIWVF